MLFKFYIVFGYIIISNFFISIPRPFPPGIERLFSILWTRHTNPRRQIFQFFLQLINQHGQTYRYPPRLRFVSLVWVGLCVHSGSRSTNIVVWIQGLVSTAGANAAAWSQGQGHQPGTRCYQVPDLFWSSELPDSRHFDLGQINNAEQNGSVPVSDIN